jgi:hypothetical protein
MGRLLVPSAMIVYPVAYLRWVSAFRPLSGASHGSPQVLCLRTFNNITFVLFVLASTV